MISVNQLQVISETISKLKADFESNLDYLESRPKYELMDIFKEREAKWRELLTIMYEELFKSYNGAKELLLEQIASPIYIDVEDFKVEKEPDLTLKVTWRRLENSTEPFMFEPVGNSWRWVNYRQSQCYDPSYKPFFKDESKGMGAFRKAIKLGYVVVKVGD